MDKEQFKAKFEGKSLKSGTYRILELTGAGGFGAVFKAEDTRRSTLVAVKIFDQSMDPLQFEQEASTQSHMYHPNIVPVFWHDIEKFDDPESLSLKNYPYIVMKYANNGALSDRLRKVGPLPLGESVDYLVQAANGVQHAHDNNTLHRDIKPANLLLHQVPGYAHPDLMVSDFGLAIRAHTGKPGDSLSMQIIGGSIEYMAPEQFNGRAIRESDIYSLGIVAFELFTGRRPFKVTNPGEALYAHSNSTPPSFRHIRGNQMSHELGEMEGVVIRAMAKSTDKRQSSVGDFGQEIKDTYERATTEAAKQKKVFDLAQERKKMVQERRKKLITRITGTARRLVEDVLVIPGVEIGIAQQIEGKEIDDLNGNIRIARRALKYHESRKQFDKAAQMAAALAPYNPQVAERSMKKFAESKLRFDINRATLIAAALVPYNTDSVEELMNSWRHIEEIDYQNATRDLAIALIPFKPSTIKELMKRQLEIGTTSHAAEIAVHFATYDPDVSENIMRNLSSQPDKVEEISKIAVALAPLRPDAVEEILLQFNSNVYKEYAPFIADIAIALANDRPEIAKIAEEKLQSSGATVDTARVDIALYPYRLKHIERVIRTMRASWLGKEIAPHDPALAEEAMIQLEDEANNKYHNPDTRTHSGTYAVSIAQALAPYRPNAVKEAMMRFEQNGEGYNGVLIARDLVYYNPEGVQNLMDKFYVAKHYHNISEVAYILAPYKPDAVKHVMNELIVKKKYRYVARIAAGFVSTEPDLAESIMLSLEKMQRHGDAGEIAKEFIVQAERDK